MKKKHILTIALVLVLLISLGAAGTMAKYSYEGEVGSFSLTVLSDKRYVVPEGATYYVGVTSTTLGEYTGHTAMYTGGDRVPDVSAGDVFVYGDYEYRFGMGYGTESKAWTVGYNESNGWGVRVLNSNKQTYGQILEEINGRPITQLRATFYNCPTITTIPEIPPYVLSITDLCASSPNVNTMPQIPEGVLDMDYAFLGTGITSATTIPASVRAMYRAFEGCTSLTGIIKIHANPSSYTNCFKNTSKEIYLTGTSSVLAELAATDGYTDLSTNDNVRIWDISHVLQTDGSGTITGLSTFGKTLSSIDIPAQINGVTTTVIGEGAFWNVPISSVTIPDTITRIGSLAFSWTHITSISIPASITDIDPSAFTSCRLLSEIVVDAGNTAYSSADGALYNKDQTTLISVPGGYPDRSFTVGANVTTIHSYAFYNNDRLYSIYVDGANPNYTSVDGVLFTKDMVTLVAVPKYYATATYVSLYAIPEGVQIIGERAFAYNMYIRDVTMPTSVTEIKSSAFYAVGAGHTVTINYAGSESQWNSIGLSGSWNSSSTIAVNYA